MEPSRKRVGALPQQKDSHLHPYLDQEVPSPQSGLPRHPAFIHGLQVLQGRERRRRRELLNGRVRWEGKDTWLQAWERFPSGQPHPHGTSGERPLCLLLEVGGAGQRSPGKGWPLKSQVSTHVMSQRHLGPAYLSASLLKTRSNVPYCTCLYVHACHFL